MTLEDVFNEISEIYNSHPGFAEMTTAEFTFGFVSKSFKIASNSLETSR